ncbi:MAG TPA: LLM class flavin-dependent oxidoreductase [Trebonia sp.]|nr:LLM class flavin-dependent oxidoreductase [Trebonia sp.]
MSLRFHWFLPTNGDGRDIVGGGHGVATGAAGAIRPPSLAYLGQVARSAEQLGFDAALTPTGAWCEDAWLTTAMLTEVTERLRFLVAFRPGLVGPTLSAQMASTFQRLSRGRLLLNVVTGGESSEQRAYGDFLSKDERYARTGEFLDIVTRLWRGEAVTASGPHLSVEGARLSRLPDPIPEIYFGGSSKAAGPVAARYSDVYLTWGEPPRQVAGKIAGITDLAQAHGRQPRFGIRLHTISRDTSAGAWQQAGYLMERVTDDMIAAVQAGLARSESEGQRRMRALHGSGSRRDVRDLEVYPGLWAGVGLVRGGAGTCLVGSHAEVADLIEEYAGLGITEFILSGYPHLEEAYWFGEGVLPLLERRGLWSHPAPAREAPPTTRPFAPTHHGASPARVAR